MNNLLAAIPLSVFLEDANIIRLSIEDQRRFAELLLKPPTPAPAGERAKQAHSQLISKIPLTSS